MSKSSIKSSVTVNLLKIWKVLNPLYEKLIEEKKYIVVLIGALLFIMGLLIVFRENTLISSKLDFDPYDLMGVTRETPKNQIRRAFRKLSLKMHPDRNLEDETAKDKFVQLQKAKEILLDDTKRENLDKYGDPDGQSRYFDLESYPDFIRRPGKKLITFYAILSSIFLILPLAIIILSPGLKEPPTWVLENIKEMIQDAESDLANGNDSALKKIENVKSNWESLCRQFPDYEGSKWNTILTFRIEARRIQYSLLKKDKQTSINILHDFKSKHKKWRKVGSIQSIISAQATDIINTARNELSQKDSKIIIELVNNICPRKYKQK